MATKRPMSAPKANDVTAAIPRIVLDDRDSGGGDPTSPRPSTLNPPRPAAPNGPGVTSAVAPDAKVSPEGAGGYGVGYVPHRCNSDIGLPTASMPNLTLALTLGEDGGGGRGKLGVYCSPRTTRRSVDLDVTSRDPASRHDYDWLEDRTSSLHVLSASSRVGSALSLNSVCTAHSVGLLSNDSDDDFQDASINDSSISEGPQGSDRAAPGTQLRRLQSYPEQDHSGPNDAAGVSPRTSHSLCNLKAAQAGPALQADHRGRAPGPAPEPELTPEKLSLLPSDVDECGSGGGGGGGRRHTPQPGPAERRDRRVEGVKAGGGARQKVVGGREDVKKVHMVSYGTSANFMKEGRIRRWLEDMDKAS
ncbi:hypothetical protein ACOMHN_038030 [Nucella lapillus]